MTLPTLTVQVAFGQTLGAAHGGVDWTDVTDYVRAEGSVVFNRGRSLPGQSASAGTCQIVLDNTDGRFTPGRSDGPHGAVTARCPIRVAANAGSGVRDLWWGFVTSWEWTIDREVRVTVAAADIIAVAGKTVCLPWLMGRNRRAPAISSVTYDTATWTYDDPEGGYDAVTAAAPTGYWPLDDKAGTLEARSGLPGGTTAPVLSAGGTVTFGVDSDLTAEDDPVLAMATTGGEASLLQGSAAAGTDGTHVSGGDAGDVLVSGWFRWVGSETRQLWRLNVATGGTVTWMQASVGESSELGRIIMHATGRRWVFGDTNLLGDVWNHIAVAIDQTYSPSGSHLKVWINGVNIPSDSTAADTSVTTAIRVLPSQRLWWALGPWNGQIAHFSVWGVGDNTDVAALVAHLADRGTAAPSAADRWADLPWLTANPLALSSWMTADADADATISQQDTGNRRLVEVCQQVANTEAGYVVATRDGLLTLQSSTGRTNAAAHLTLDAGTDVLAVDGAFTVEDVDLVDEATVTNMPGGATFRSTRVDPSGAPVESAIESAAVEVWAADSTQAETLANWLTAKDGTVPRSPSLTVSMDWAAVHGWADDLLTLEIGDTVALTDLPATAPDDAMELTVEAISHAVAGGGWTVTVDTSIADHVWQVEDATYGAITDNRLAM